MILGRTDVLSWLRILVLLLLLPLSALAQDKAEIFLQLGHSDVVNAVAFSPDGHLVASGSKDKSIKLWDVVSRRELRTLGGHSNTVSAVAFSPDGHTLVSASYDNTLKLWDVASGRELRTLRGHTGLVTAVAFASDGRTFISGSADTTLKLWDAASGRELRTLRGHTDSVIAVAVSPDGRTLVSGSYDKTLKLWNVQSGHELRTLAGHTESIKAVAFSPNGRLLVSGGEDTIRLWDALSGRELRVLSTDRPALFVTSVAFSPDGRMIVFGDGNATLNFWDVASGRILHTLSGHSSLVSAVAFSPEGHTIISGSEDSTLRLWDVASGRELSILGGYSRRVTDVAISPDGRMIASGGWDIRLWDVANGQVLRILRGHRGSITTVAFSPDGRALASGSTDTTLKLWDVQNGQELRALTGHSEWIGDVTFSPDGRTVVSGGRDGLLEELARPTGRAHTIRLWDVASGKEVRTLRYTKQVWRVAFSRDGRTLASSSYDENIKLWDVQSGQEQRTLRGHSGSVVAFAFSPDGRTLASGSLDKTIKLWDVQSGREQRTLKAKARVSAIAFSPDGRTIVLGSEDNALTLLDVASGRELRTLKGHSNVVSAVAISPDGRTVVSSSHDSSIRLWDAATGNEKVMLVGFKDDEWIAMTPQGYYTGSEKADQYVNVRIGNRVHGVDQYREKFYRPEIVQAALAGKPITGLASLTSVKPAPSVSIVETPASMGSDEATVKVKVADEGGGIGDVRLYLNGSAVVLDRTRNLAVSKVQGKAQTFSYKVRLVPGKNAIRAIAFNAENSMQSMDALYEIEAKIAAKKPSLHALVIGIQEYENPKLTLKYPVADASLMASVLREQTTGLFERVNVVELTAKPQTTKEAIAKTLREMSEKVQPDDLFVFFVASHGTVDEGEYYLITSNVGALSTHILKKSALSQDDLKAMIANVPATKKLVVIDTCNAGKLGEALHVAMLTRGMNEETAMKILSRAVGSTVLSASNSVQEALEGYKDHGLFTWVVAEGLRGAADSDKDGYVKTHELVNYVDDKVPVVAEQVFKHKQYPTTTLSGQGFPVVRVK